MRKGGFILPPNNPGVYDSLTFASQFRMGSSGQSNSIRISYVSNPDLQLLRRLAYKSGESPVGVAPTHASRTDLLSVGPACDFSSTAKRLAKGLNL
jgi:hypothetical protein